MQRRIAMLAVLGGWLLAAGSLSAGDPPTRARQSFVWKDGDKVALIGGTVIEREQNYGQWEVGPDSQHSGEERDLPQSRLERGYRLGRVSRDL